MKMKAHNDVRLLATAVLTSLLGSLPTEVSMANSDVDNNTAVARPAIHFTPPSGWMNDPNGLVFYEDEYHLFYQYYPDDLRWGPMHWGHAISTDLVSWEHLPIALEPDADGYIFSGSIVIDYANSSGLGTPTNPPMVALYTLHDEAKKTKSETDIESQALAYSVDRGRTWQKYAANPVLRRPELRDFRDPKVSWHEASARWIMVVTHGDEVGFYSSENLINWTFESSFGEGYGTHEGVWECPDLIDMGDQYALIVSLVPGGPNGGSGTQYFIGQFDGQRFSPAPQHQQDPEKPLWLDWGPDNYAGVTFSNTSGTAPLFMGWASNWTYAQEVPATTWRSAMSLPRQLFLYTTNDHMKPNAPLRIGSKLAPTLTTGWKTEVANSKSNADTNTTSIALPETSTKRLRLNLILDETTPTQFSLHNKENESVVIELDSLAAEIRVDRTRSGITSFNNAFAAVLKAQHDFAAGETQIELVYDGNIIEIYVDGGKTVMTILVFPTASFDQLTVADATVGLVELQSR